MATHFSILAWRIPRTDEPGGLQSMGSQRVDTTKRLSLSPTPCPRSALISQSFQKETMGILTAEGVSRSLHTHKCSGLG